MQIVIPTYRRTDSQLTFSQFPEEWKRKTRFVIDEHDWEIMVQDKKLVDAKLTVVPETVTTIAQKRKWIIENIECKKMMMFDDDLQFAIRRYRDNGKISQCKPLTEEIDHWFKEADKMLDQYAHIGFSARQFNNTRPQGWAHNSRMMYSLGYQPEVVKRECILGRIEHREDMDITLQLFAKGYENRVCSELCHDQIYNSEGGCSEQRTLDKSNEDAELLAQLHPGLIRVVEKDYKRSMRRKEVVVQWKKALNAKLSA